MVGTLLNALIVMEQEKGYSMASKNKPKSTLQKTIQTRKKFFYGKDTVTLSFELAVDDSSELRDFLYCLKEAQMDIMQILDRMKN